MYHSVFFLRKEHGAWKNSEEVYWTKSRNELETKGVVDRLSVPPQLFGKMRSDLIETCKLLRILDKNFLF